MDNNCHVKRIEKIENKNCKSESNHFSNAFALSQEYRKLLAKIREHNAALREVTLNVLQLDLLKLKKNNSKKVSIVRNEKLKKYPLKTFRNKHKYELLVIKKLLLINLKTFEAVQRICVENSELQMTLEKTHSATQQKQQLQQFNQENNNLQSAARCFKARLSVFFNKLDNVTNSIICHTFTRSGFGNLLQISNDCDNEPVLREIYKFNDLSYSNKVSIVKENFENKVSVLTDHRNEFLQKPSLHFPSKLSLFLNIPVLLYHLQRPYNDLAHEQLCLENIRNTNQLVGSEIYNTEKNSPQVFVRKINDENIKDLCIFKNTKSLLPFKYINNLKKNISDYANLTNLFMFFEYMRNCLKQNQSVNIYYKNNNDTLYIAGNAATINERIKYISSKKTDCHINDSAEEACTIQCTGLNENQPLVIDENISIGVGNGSTLCFDQQSQVEDNLLRKIGSEDSRIHDYEDIAENKIKPQMCNEIAEKKFDANDISPDFQKSLQNLREIIEYSKKMTEPTSTSNINKITTQDSNKYFIKQSSEKSTKTKLKRGKYFVNVNKTEYKKIRKIPDMSKAYEIVLQSNAIQGTSLRFIKLNTHDVQINNAFGTNISKSKRTFRY